MIVALGHLSRTGKDTVANALSLYYDPHEGAIRTGFIWEAKKIAHQLFGWAGLHDREHYENFPAEREQVLPALGKTPLQIWIELGIKLNEIHPTALTGSVVNGAPTDRLTIISDLRRPSEIVEVRKAGGVVVKVHKPGAIPKSQTDRQLSDFAQWDYILVNDGSMEDLIKQAQLLAALLRKDYAGALSAICPNCYSRKVRGTFGSSVFKCEACGCSWLKQYNREIHKW